MTIFPIFRSDRTDRVLTELFLCFAETDFQIVEPENSNMYYTRLISPMGVLEFKHGSAYYFGNKGSFTPSNKAVQTLRWEDRMPSRAAVKKLKKEIEALQIKQFRTMMCA